jgi:transposase InsO family protein
MREHGLQAPHRVGRRRGPRNHDGSIIPGAVDVMWGTDMTAAVTLGEGQARVFAAVDHFSGALVGIHASKSGNRFEALEPIRQGVRERFEAFGPGVAEGLALRHDHGSQYISKEFREEIAFLGIQSSPAFVRAPEGNGCVERFFRTLKENLLWVRTFEGIEDLRQALHRFKDEYNSTWLLARHGYKTPDQVRVAQRNYMAEAA